MGNSCTKSYDDDETPIPIVFSVDMPISIEPEKFNELGIEGLVKNVRAQFQKLTDYELDS